MSLYTPYFRCEPCKDGFRVQHNCDGDLNFCAETVVDAETGRLIKLAISEGKRQRSREIRSLFNDA